VADSRAFRAYLDPLWTTDWFVYAKRPFAGPEQVLAYLSRYTHRVAISNSRLLSADESGVTFKYKDLCRVRHRSFYADLRAMSNGLVFPRIHSNGQVIDSAYSVIWLRAQQRRTDDDCRRVLERKPTLPASEEWAARRARRALRGAFG